jgi:hypothetical protein
MATLVRLETGPDCVSTGRGFVAVRHDSIPALRALCAEHGVTLGPVPYMYDRGARFDIESGYGFDFAGALYSLADGLLACGGDTRCAHCGARL